MNTAEEQAAYDELFEFDRRLRTGNYESQLRALAILPEFFERIKANPLLLSTTFLRITDYFCATTNEMRNKTLNMLRSCTSFSKYIEIHADEIIRRLGIIWESNDVLARSLVVKFLGLLAEGISGRAEALYRIQQSLTSEFEDEVDSALAAVINLIKFNAKFVLPIISVAALKVLHESHIHSHRIPKLLSIFQTPSFDAKMELIIINQLQQWQQTNPDIVEANSCIKMLQERLGLS